MHEIFKGNCEDKIKRFLNTYFVYNIIVNVFMGYGELGVYFKSQGGTSLKKLGIPCSRRSKPYQGFSLKIKVV